MGRPRTLTPTATGRKILAVIDEAYGGIAAAARACGVTQVTLRRRIYGPRPKLIDRATNRRLLTLGIPAALLE